jgi:hypothetical protein
MTLLLRDHVRDQVRDRSKIFCKVLLRGPVCIHCSSFGKTARINHIDSGYGGNGKPVFRELLKANAYCGRALFVFGSKMIFC